MNSFKKILPYILVALVFAIGGFFIGKIGVSDDQGASLFKGVSKNTSGIIHLTWANGECRILSWDATNNKWREIGTLGVSQRDCRDIAHNGATDMVSNITSTQSTDITQLFPKDTTGISSVINMVWANGLGCTVWRWNDANKNWDSLGVANGVSEKDCKSIKKGFSAPTIIAPNALTPKATGASTAPASVSR